MSATEQRPLLAGLPPLMADRSRVLILGSFPSAMSLAKREYYGNPQNHFWPVMEALFGIDRSLPYQKRTTRLASKGVAVWDVIAQCTREGSGDDRIANARPNPLAALLEAHSNIRYIAFNGGTAHRTARALTPEIFQLVGLRFEQLPSTSPRHAKISLTAKAAAWSKLKKWVKGARVSVDLGTRRVASGMSIAEVADECGLTIEDVRQALTYTADRDRPERT